jgi:hypothetical protein
MEEDGFRYYHLIERYGIMLFGRVNQRISQLYWPKMDYVDKVETYDKLKDVIKNRRQMIVIQNGLADIEHHVAFSQS